jgi:plasmid stabilization system protein ParE
MEQGSQLKVKWTLRATRQMLAIEDYIRQDSDKQARKVVLAIDSTLRKATLQPLRFPPDKYRRPNDSTYRAFTKYHCRVAYRILKSEIRIVQVRHTSRKPHYY